MHVYIIPWFSFFRSLFCLFFFSFLCPLFAIVSLLPLSLYFFLSAWPRSILHGTNWRINLETFGKMSKAREFFFIVRDYRIRSTMRRHPVKCLSQISLILLESNRIFISNTLDNFSDSMHTFKKSWYYRFQFPKKLVLILSSTNNSSN